MLLPDGTQPLAEDSVVNWVFSKTNKKTLVTTLSGLLIVGLSVTGIAAGFASALNYSSQLNNNTDAWPTFSKDPAHSGYSASPGPLTNQTLWSYKTDSIKSSPTVVGGVVYFGSKEVLALNVSTATILWSYQSGGGVFSAPSLADGRVFFGSWDNNIYALNASTGALLWSYRTGSYVQSSPVVVNGVVYTASYDANVYALDAVTGNALWIYPTGSGAVGSSPAVVNGLVYIGDNGGQVHAINAATGARVWKFNAGDTIYSSPSVVNGVVYIGGDTMYNGTLYALDAQTGLKLWSYPTGSFWIYSSPVAVNNVVYVGSFNPLDNYAGYLFALDIANGKLLWSYPTGGIVFASPAVAGGVVYIGGGDKHVYALDAESGALVWSYGISSATSLMSFSSPAIVDGVLYIGSEDGILYAFGSSQPLSPSPTPTLPPTPPPNPNSTVQATTGSGRRVNLTISGNITASQISNTTIAVSNDTAAVSFTITGKSGNAGFCNISIPQSEVPNGAAPIVYIDGQPADNQGYNKDTNSYNVWFTTHFSTHNLAIWFTAHASTPDMQNQTSTEPNYPQVIYGLLVSAVVVAIIVALIGLFVREKKTKP